MARDFGKTWWGEHWLRSLDNIDYDNRLPRGASYARKGYVKEVKIVGNQINAKVKGSRPSPYKVTIIVPPFFEENINRLMDKIIERPVLISKLLNRELDPEILNIAESLDLKVFPKQWTDFKMQCSCPDWAVPCKHLAAVVYMVSREIDNNPFLVFEIHKVNLIDELRKRGIDIAEQQNAEIPLLADTWKLSKEKNLVDVDNEQAFKRVDCSLLQDNLEALVSLLPDSPPFYSNGNFRDKYAIQLRRITKDAGRFFKKNLDIKLVFPVKSDFELINHHTKFSIIEDDLGEYSITSDVCEYRNVSELANALYLLNPDHLQDYQPSVAVLHQVMIVSLQLMAKGLVVPQIVQLADKSFSIRWLPAIIDVEVAKMLEKLTLILPSDILRVKKIVRKKELLSIVENQAVELLSLFLTEIISNLHGVATDDSFLEMFFQNRPQTFKGVGENALSGGVKVWLDRYYMTADEYKPLITVSESVDDQFELFISIEDTKDAHSLPIPLKNILGQKQYDKQRFKILQSLSLLSPFIKGLDACINDGAERAIVFNTKDFAPFIMQVLPVIRLLGVHILLPKSLQELLRPKASVRLVKKTADGKSFLRLDDLLSFDWQIAIGNQVMSPEEYKKLIKNATGLMKFKGNYIYVDDSDLEKLHKQFTQTRELNAHKMLQTALAEEFEGAPIVLSNEVRELMQELTSNSDIELPSGLNAQLRPYQHRGFSWMYRNSRIGFGSIIADDMGLGKTLQVITLLLKLKEEEQINKKHPVMIVVPTGLLTNWQLEIQKFAPSLSTHIYHGPNRDIDDFNADILLTSYGVIRGDKEKLKKFKWMLLVIDEAQNIKNYNTEQSKAIKGISSQFRIAMSGTPVENRLSEFWSIMDFANKGFLGNIKSFNEDYANPIQIDNNEHVVSRFRKVTAPFMMRRMKTDKTIISDLPDKIEQNQFSILSKPQAVLYEKTMQVAMDEIEGISSNDSKSLFKRQGLVLQMILALKQICNHPTQYLKNDKLDASLSGKTELLLELLESIVDSGDKVLVFTQFREMGELLQHFIEERFGEKPMFYHGGCTVEQRNTMVHDFQHNRADKIFILSLKAAGTGLNLTAASHVIHYDLWWNPAVESQATDRAFRIGQKKNVMVHRFITNNTFEERIDEMIQSKKHLADLTVATGESWIGKMSNKELREIFG